MQPYPLCIAHRGARQEAPENTRAAFQRALDYAIDGIEFDVQMSRDGTLILFHDATLEKVGGGIRPVADMTGQQLRQIDWGGWFHADFTGEPLMQLTSALEMVDRFDHMLIEIKSHPDERPGGHPYRLTREAIRLIEQPSVYPYQDRIAILSFDPHVLKTAHAMAPQLRYVLNVPENDLNLAHYDTRFLWAVDFNIDRVSADHIAQAKTNGLKTFVYTCNHPEQVDKACQLGVDGIISDRPGWLIDCVRTRPGI